MRYMAKPVQCTCCSQASKDFAGLGRQRPGKFAAQDALKLDITSTGRTHMSSYVTQANSVNSVSGCTKACFWSLSQLGPPVHAWMWEFLELQAVLESSPHLQNLQRNPTPMLEGLKRSPAKISLEPGSVAC